MDNKPVVKRYENGKWVKKDIEVVINGLTNKTMNKEKLQQKQDELDEETLLCPKCGKEEKWGFIREWGDCNECVADSMRKNK